jgi:hypothetical protein
MKARLEEACVYRKPAPVHIKEHTFQAGGFTIRPALRNSCQAGTNTSCFDLDRDKARNHTCATWRICYVILVLLIATMTSSALAQEQIGFVIESNGNWFLDGNPVKPISQGSGLPAKGVVKIQSPYHSYSYIKIGDRQGKIIIVKQCGQGDDCDQPITLPQNNPGSPSFASRLFDAIVSIVKDDHSKHAVFGSQGSGEKLREAVVSLKDERVDLSRVFVNVKKDQYLLSFKPINLPDKSATPLSLDEIMFNWDPNNPVPLQLKGLRPGVYEVQQLDKQSKEPLGLGTEAWILASVPADYEKLSSCFQGAETLLTTQWGQQVKVNTVRSFLRAYLDDLIARGSRCT